MKCKNEFNLEVIDPQEASGVFNKDQQTKGKRKNSSLPQALCTIINMAKTKETLYDPICKGFPEDSITLPLACDRELSRLSLHNSEGFGKTIVGVKNNQASKSDWDE